MMFGDDAIVKPASREYWENKLKRDKEEKLKNTTDIQKRGCSNMGINLIPTIVDKLGVEIGEEFNVTGYEKTIRFKFDKTGLLWIDECEKSWTYTDVSTFFRLINGDNGVIKLPFKPKLYEQYLTYDDNWEVVAWDWWGDFEDLIRRNSGYVFRTKEEAIKARPRIYKELTGEEWEE